MLGGIMGPVVQAIAGGVSGGQKDKSSTSSNGSSYLHFRDFADITRGQGQLEKDAYNSQLKQFADLLGLVNQGPGQTEVNENNQFQRAFGTQLQSLLNEIASPTAAGMAANQAKAKDLFGAEQTALNQQFDDQRVAASRLSARLGRPGNDPILANKLMQEQTRQQTMLNSQIGSYARQLPEITAQNVMNVGGALSNLRQGLASQAMANRQALLQMGGQLASAERNFRMGAATQAHTGMQETIGGGGFKGAWGGAMAGLGNSASFASKIMSMGGGGMAGGAGGFSGPTGGGATPQASGYFG
jgi:hypothetical protein